MSPTATSSTTTNFPTTSTSSTTPVTTIKHNGFCTLCQTHHRPALVTEMITDQSGQKKERCRLRHLQHCPKTAPIVIPLFLHGAAGMGIGSRLKGNAKMGGSKIPERHMQHGIVAKTNENMSSRTCPFCFRLVRLARGRRIRKGEAKLVRVHGAIECINPDCISARCGYGHRPRDSNAALNIALIGHTVLTSPTRQTLPPFTNNQHRWLHPNPDASCHATGEITQSDVAAPRRTKDLDSSPT